MNKRTSTFLLLTVLSLVLIVSAACFPPATPVPPAATDPNSITNIVWQWTNVSNKTN